MKHDRELTTPGGLAVTADSDLRTLTITYRSERGHEVTVTRQPRFTAFRHYMEAWALDELDRAAGGAQ